MASNYGYNYQQQSSNYQPPGSGGYQQPGGGGYQQSGSGGYQQSGSGGYQPTASSGGYNQPGSGGYQQTGGGGYQQTGSGGYQQPGSGGYQPPASGSSYQPQNQAQTPASTTMAQYPTPSGYTQSGSNYSSWGYYGNQQSQNQYQSQQTPSSQYNQSPGQSGNRSQGGNQGGSWNQSSYGYNSASQQQPKQGKGSNQTGEEHQRYYYQSSLGSTPGGPSAQNSQPSNPPLPFSTSFSSKNQQSGQPQSTGYGGSKFVSAAKQYYGKKQQRGRGEGHDNQAYSQYLNAYITQRSQTVPGYNYQQQQQQSPRIPFKRKPPVDPTKYYCELCKVACVSDQNFQAHLTGKAHQKKASQSSNVSAIPGVVTYRCEVCTITCSGKDALEAHLNGSKHKKSMKMLHTMNKPIPNPLTTMITAEKMEDGSVQQKKEKTDVQKGPKIKFIGGQHLSSTGELVTADPSQKKQAYPPGIEPPAVVKDPVEEIRDNPALMDYKDPDPVGLELVIRAKKDPNQPQVIFKCTMCDCFFNDDNAKLMHCKGRRHRLNYKKEHDPTLVVDPPRSEIMKKAKARAKRDERFKQKQTSKGSHFNSKQEESQQPSGESQEKKFGKRTRKPMPRPKMLSYYGLPETVDDYKYWTSQFEYDREEDQLLLAKHNSVTWLAPQYDAAEAFIDNLEKGLKQVSDQLLQEKMTQMEVAEDKDKGRDEALREIRGIMTVGDYSSRTLVQGDTTVELVITCSVKPTIQLLKKVTKLLEEKMKDVCPDKQFSVVSDADSACFLVHTTVGDEANAFQLEVKVFLTSLEMREDKAEEEASEAQTGDDSVLSRKWCSYALALQRRSQQFKNEVEGLIPTVILMRLFKGFRKSRPEFASCSTWVIELLVSQVVYTAHEGFSYIGDIFKRVFECLSSGMLMPGAPGIIDPCERKPTDATENMSAQEREDLTAAAQYILRLMAFGQLRDLLGVEVPACLQGQGGDKERTGDVDFSSDLPKEKKPKTE